MEDTTKQDNNNLFDSFSINDLFKKIYLNHHAKEELVLNLLEEIKLNLIDGPSIAMLGPIVKDLSDTSIKNDEMLIKLANVASKILADNNKQTMPGFDDMIQMSSSEKSDLLKRLDDLSVDMKIDGN